MMEPRIAAPSAARRESTVDTLQPLARSKDLQDKQIAIVEKKAWAVHIVRVSISCGRCSHACSEKRGNQKMHLDCP